MAGCAVVNEWGVDGSKMEGEVQVVDVL